MRLCFFGSLTLNALGVSGGGSRFMLVPLEDVLKDVFEVFQCYRDTCDCEDHAPPDFDFWMQTLLVQGVALSIGQGAKVDEYKEHAPEYFEDITAVMQQVCEQVASGGRAGSFTIEKTVKMLEVVRAFYSSTVPSQTCVSATAIDEANTEFEHKDMSDLRLAFTCPVGEYIQTCVSSSLVRSSGDRIADRDAANAFNYLQSFGIMQDTLSPSHGLFTCGRQVASIMKQTYSLLEETVQLMDAAVTGWSQIRLEEHLSLILKWIKALREKLSAIDLYRSHKFATVLAELNFSLLAVGPAGSCCFYSGGAAAVAVRAVLKT